MTLLFAMSALYMPMPFVAAAEQNFSGKVDRLANAYARIGFQTEVTIDRSEAYVHSVAGLKQLRDKEASAAMSKLDLATQALAPSELRSLKMQYSDLTILGAPADLGLIVKNLMRSTSAYISATGSAANPKGTDPESAAYTQVKQCTDLAIDEARLRKLLITWMRFSGGKGDNWNFEAASVIADVQVGAKSGAKMSPIVASCGDLVKTAPPAGSALLFDAVKGVRDTTSRAAVVHSSPVRQMLSDTNSATTALDTE